MYDSVVQDYFDDQVPIALTTANDRCAGRLRTTIDVLKLNNSMQRAFCSAYGSPVFLINGATSINVAL